MVKRSYPFSIDAWVLPDHLHCLGTLPPGEDDFSKRWQLIKRHFSRRIPLTKPRSEVRIKRGEWAIWQRRYWEHDIRDQRDFATHTDYIHSNPVKHSYAERVADWPYSTFHQYVKQGIYSLDWTGERAMDNLPAGEPDSPCQHPHR